jgi:hypothetical protein
VNETTTHYDAAAAEAEHDLTALLNAMTEEEKKGARQVFQWQAKHYLTAGHKRLGRILVKLAGVTSK